MPRLPVQDADVGKVVLVEARLVAIYADGGMNGLGIATVRLANGSTAGGRGAWTQVPVALRAIKAVVPDNPDEGIVPIHIDRGDSH